MQNTRLLPCHPIHSFAKRRAPHVHFLQTALDPAGASRIAILWPVKAVGTMLFMGAFFWGYFGVLSHPLFPTTIMPLIGLDEWVPHLRR